MFMDIDCAICWLIWDWHVLNLYEKCDWYIYIEWYGIDMAIESVIVARMMMMSLGRYESICCMCNGYEWDVMLEIYEWDVILEVTCWNMMTVIYVERYVITTTIGSDNCYMYAKRYHEWYYSTCICIIRR